MDKEQIKLTIEQADTIHKTMSKRTCDYPNGGQLIHEWYLEDTNLDGVVCLCDNEFREGRSILIDSAGSVMEL